MSFKGILIEYFFAGAVLLFEKRMLPELMKSKWGDMQKEFSERSLFIWNLEFRNYLDKIDYKKGEKMTLNELVHQRKVHLK